MFLITTYDKRLFRTDKPILCLGEWCKLYSDRTLWEKTTHEVLPYHWDDRKKLYRDYLLLDQVYEKSLKNLTELLNQIHGTEHSLRFWRIVIGPWLSHFMAVLYDRHQSIIQAVKSEKVTGTLILENQPGKWVPQGHSDFFDWIINDDYNQYLFGRIIEFTKCLPFEAVNMPASVCNGVKPRTERSRFARVASKLMNLIGNRFNKIVFVESTLDHADLAKLSLSLRQIPQVFFRNPSISKPAFDAKMRAPLAQLPGTSEFERLLAHLLPEQIPFQHMEGFAEMKALSLRQFPKHPKIICNGVAFNTNEAFKLWAGHHVDRGAKLVSIQHGGHYGMGLWSTTEDHLIKISDKYFTWGWQTEETQVATPIPAAPLNKIRNSIAPKKNGSLLLVLGCVPRYSYYLYSFMASSTGFLSYLDEQFRFVRTLSDKNQQSLITRLYSRNYGWDQDRRWLDNFPNMKLCRGDQPIASRLNESRLFIGTYNATTYLETFAANFPTLLFWNPNQWELRPSAEQYFNRLRDVGILHHSPEAAAAKVNEISSDPIGWWGQPKIQSAKDEFCSRFAKTSDNWIEEWKTELQLLAGR